MLTTPVWRIVVYTATGWSVTTGDGMGCRALAISERIVVVLFGWIFGTFHVFYLNRISRTKFSLRGEECNTPVFSRWFSMWFGAYDALGSYPCFRRFVFMRSRVLVSCFDVSCLARHTCGVPGRQPVSLLGFRSRVFLGFVF